MAVKNTNTRIMITMSKKQKDWLTAFCKNHEITPSKYISWLLYYKADEMLRLLKVDDSNIYTEEELIKIIQTKWLDD